MTPSRRRAAPLLGRRNRSPRTARHAPAAALWLVAAAAAALCCCGAPVPARDDAAVRTDAARDAIARDGDGSIPGSDAAVTPAPDAADAALPPAPDDAAPRAEVALGVSGRGITLDGRETFLLSISYYGGLGAATTAVRADFDRLASLGFNNVRVFGAWGVQPLAASVIRADGSLDAAVLARLDALVEAARALGMTVDLSFGYGIPAISDGGFDAYRRAIAQVATALRARRNVFFDLGNEHNIGDARFLSHDQVRDLAAAVRAADPGRLFTASVAADPATCASEYAAEYAAADLRFAAPHFPRDDTWAAQTATRVTSMRDALTAGGSDRPIYLQEEARRAYAGAQWPKSDFLTAAAGARRAGAAGWCFHNGAGFDLTARGFFDQLDAVELDTIDELAAAVR